MNKENGKILIVDDDESVLMVSKYLLSQQFNEVITLSDPKLLNGNFNDKKFDVALLDMNYTIGSTSGQEGLDLLRMFNEKFPSTRVIMMTAYIDLDIAIRAIKEGADDFIVKPWDDTKFISIVTSNFKLGPKPVTNVKTRTVTAVSDEQNKNEIKGGMPYAIARCII